MARNPVVLRRMVLPDDLERVAALAVRDDQLPFVGRMSDILRDHGDRPGVDFHVIAARDDDAGDDAADTGTVVGFFLTDRGVGSAAPYAADGDLGLGKFFVDRRRQGRGHGTAAARQLRTYVRGAYPQFRALVLTVNCKNPGAARVYRNAGFRGSERDLYLGGSAGPQYVMRMPLED